MSSRKFIDLCRAAAYRQNAYGERARSRAFLAAVLGIAYGSPSQHPYP